MLTLAHAFFTIAMFGFMLAVQLVVYPQFRHATADLAAFSDAHTRNIITGLAVLAPAEVVLGAWLFVDTPDQLSRTAVFISGALLAAGWVSTGAWFAPLHGRIHRLEDPQLVTTLITTNWFRTGLWAVRAAMAIYFVAQLI